MQFSSKHTTNRFLFSLLVATVVIPLPAMTPALLSGAVGAMSLIATAPLAEQARFVPVYFVPGRPGAPARPPAMLPDTVLSGIADPRSVISEIPEDQSLAFEPLRPIPIIAAFDRPPTPWGWLTSLPGGGGGDRVLTSPVPEPGTWAMMTSGFLAAGAIIRRRRRRMAVAAA